MKSGFLVGKRLVVIPWQAQASSYHNPLQRLSARKSPVERLLVPAWITGREVSASGSLADNGPTRIRPLRAIKRTGLGESVIQATRFGRVT